MAPSSLRSLVSAAAGGSAPTAGGTAPTPGGSWTELFDIVRLPGGQGDQQRLRVLLLPRPRSWPPRAASQLNALIPLLDYVTHASERVSALARAAIETIAIKSTQRIF
jgi:hypothetical protein